MATQSLYRRYRPRRFAEVKGQEHVVRALRDAVAEGREGQAYLFSGPRGTGKTTTARILAKALNCPNVDGGEPCAECDSCIAVERGTSYDVHELDAASNNGVEAIRDLIEKASLGTPGRHKVYILDEVHMLSKPAEAALLKTLEEPPSHVVFVLATTDPQKMSDTIRSRTQHLQFHLLPPDTLAEHIKWVAADAHLDLPQAALDAALAQGGGSARDTLSALELLAATGGEVGEVVDLDEFLRAFATRDAGQALTAMAHAVSVGRDPRTVTEELVRHLRNAFLAVMAPDLVVLPRDQVDALALLAQQIGAAHLVRAIEQLGVTLVDLRNAPDPRVLVEVVLVQLTSDAAGGDVAALEARLERLTEQVRQLTERVESGAVSSPMPTAASGRAVLGGAARREPAAPASPSPAASAEPAAASEPSASPAQPTATTGLSIDAAWEQAKGSLKGLARPLYAATTLLGESGGVVRFEIPPGTPVAKCEGQRPAVEQALSTVLGRRVTVELVTGHGGGVPAHEPDAPVATAPAAEPPRPAPRAPLPVEAIADEPVEAEPELEADDEVDLDALTDVPPESVKGPDDQLAEAFPGSAWVQPDDR